MTGVLDKKPVKLFIAVAGIYISYIYYGYFIEKLFKHNYGVSPESTQGNQKPIKFTYGFATSIFQNLLSFILAFLVNRLIYKQTKSKMDLKSELTIASCNFWSVFLASQALAHITFPIQALMKSSKIISILIVSPLIGSKEKFQRSQYLCGTLITAGIVIFYLTDDKKSSGADHNDLFGLTLISISLFCDGLLGTRQGEIKKKFSPSPWDQMESLNKWSGIICLVVAIVTSQMSGFLEFVYKHPEVIKDLACIAVLGTSGQIFIFYTIFNFSPLILSIITTTRKFFTVIFSVLLHGHIFNTTQWASVALVFIGVFYEMLSGDKKKHHHHHGNKAKGENHETEKLLNKEKAN